MSYYPWQQQPQGWPSQQQQQDWPQQWPQQQMYQQPMAGPSSWGAGANSSAIPPTSSSATQFPSYFANTASSSGNPIAVASPIAPIAPIGPPAPKKDGRARGGGRKRAAGEGSERGGKAGGGKKKQKKDKEAAAGSVKNEAGESSASSAARGGRGGRRGGGGPGSRGGKVGRGRGGRAGASQEARGTSARRSRARDTSIAGDSTQRAGTAGGDRSPSAAVRSSAAPNADEGANAANAAQQQEDYDEDEVPPADEEDEEQPEDMGEEEMRWREEVERTRSQAMGPLIMAMSESQYDRHESYRRSGFNRSSLRRLIHQHLSGGYSTSTSGSINQTITMAFGGVAKVFVGEIIEGARRIRRERGGVEGDAVPLSAEEILESYRDYCKGASDVVGAGAGLMGRGNAEEVMGSSGVGGGMGGRRRLF